MILYKLIGTDGREYGPANADQIRQWIRENRLERQSPIFVPGSTDWTFVGLLPEFAHDFPGNDPANTPPLIQSPPVGIIASTYPVRSNSMARAGLICGILAVTIGCCCAGLPFNVLGLVFSMMALVQIADNPRQYSGQGMAIIGLVLSACGFLIFSLALIFH